MLSDKCAIIEVSVCLWVMENIYCNNIFGLWYLVLFGLQFWKLHEINFKTPKWINPPHPQKKYISVVPGLNQGCCVSEADEMEPLEHWNTLSLH